MGLDQYLSARKFVSGVNYETDAQGNFTKVAVPEFGEMLDLVGLTVDDLRSDHPNAQLEVSVAYWRKVNSIHQWFVDNCGQGEDDCRPYFVSREKLEELRETVRDAIGNHDADLLPPASGFFFGSTEVDEWYWRDLDDTLEKLNAILTNPKFDGWEFEYQASW